MYLSQLKLWNFRKYSIDGTEEEFDSAEAGLVVSFVQGLNVLIGENDSGKSSIVDAIRLALGTQSREWLRIEEEDFYEHKGHRANKLKIECIFKGFSDQEAGPFVEWLGFEGESSESQYVLCVRLLAMRRNNGISSELRAGPDSLGSELFRDVRDRLRITYLKPLRDADAELTPGRRSRLAQILKAHALFQTETGTVRRSAHHLELIVQQANKEIEKYFKPIPDALDGQEIPEEGSKTTVAGDMSNSGVLLEAIEKYLREFFPENEAPGAQITISGGELLEILHRLSLMVDGNPAGLGTQNLLYIAAELLLLQSIENVGFRLAVVEELEAHLHPQAQLRLVHFLQNQARFGQFILSTHSTALGASIDLRSMIICKDNKAFPMGPQFTKLQPKSYEFLRRFLDATKANLFFARGVILVEGDSENLLLPTIAEIIERPLHRYGVSIVNVGSTAFLHYAQIFSRGDDQGMGIPVAVITDMDVKPLEHEKQVLATQQEVDAAKNMRRIELEQVFNTGNTRVFISPNWTLEYELALSPLRELLYLSILWAEKKENSATGEPQDKKESEVKVKVESNFAKWNQIFQNDARKTEHIAYEIYYNYMLEKCISKTIVAQELAAKMDQSKDKRQLCEVLLRSSSLRYLIEAICHVTEPIKDASAN